MANTKGVLYLIPTTLGDIEPFEVLPLYVKKVIEELDWFIVENEKTARRYIKRITPRKSQPSLKILKIDKYADKLEVRTYLDECFKGTSVGLLSEAGVPAIADPGSEIVKLYVLLKNGFEASDETKADILQFAKENLAKYKVPKIIEILKELPLTSIGKVDKKLLRTK